MNNFSFVFIIILLCVSCNKETTYPDNGDIAILTYNVAGLPEGLNADQTPTKYMYQISPLHF
jgi:hypothetical protein